MGLAVVLWGGGQRPEIGQYGGRIYWVAWGEAVSLVGVHMGVEVWPDSGQCAALFISTRTGTWAEDSKTWFWLFVVLYHKPQCAVWSYNHFSGRNCKWQTMMRPSHRGAEQVHATWVDL